MADTVDTDLLFAFEIVLTELNYIDIYFIKFRYVIQFFPQIYIVLILMWLY